MKKLCLAFCLMFLAGCTGKPDGIEPVTDFDPNRYLGTWYEIARLDHSFERGLQNVTAEYSLNDDGTIKVINKGYSTENSEWDIAEGKAKFVEGRDTGYLKVSLFGPFYGSYVIFGLDQDGYSHAFVTGPNRSYLWLLSRTPDINDELRARFVKTAQDKGFDTDQLIFVDHTDPKK